MEPRIEKKGKFNVVGIECHTTLKDNLEKNTIPRLWQEMLIPQVSRIKNITGDYGIGLEKFDPVYTDEIYHLACFEVSKIEDIPQGMIAKTIPAATYAVFSYPDDGDLVSNGNIIRYVFSEWLAKSGYTWASDYTFETYRDISPKTELYIPIK
jgi:predicted transcriptional regulator YdeE